jgi:hypothetical protein
LGLIKLFWKKESILCFNLICCFEETLFVLMQCITNINSFGVKDKDMLLINSITQFYNIRFISNIFVKSSTGFTSNLVDLSLDYLKIKKYDFCS